jgi:hypothetical protein
MNLFNMKIHRRENFYKHVFVFEWVFIKSVSKRTYIKSPVELEYMFFDFCRSIVYKILWKNKGYVSPLMTSF